MFLGSLAPPALRIEPGKFMGKAGSRGDSLQS